MALDEDERLVGRRRDGDQRRRRGGRSQRDGQRLVLGGGGAVDLAGEDPPCGNTRTSSAAGQLQPPVPVDVEDVEYLVALEGGPEPVDTLRKTAEHLVASSVGAVLVEETPAIGVRLDIAKVRTAQHVLGAPVAGQQPAQLRAVAARVELAPQEDSDDLLLSDRVQKLHASKVALGLYQTLFPQIACEHVFPDESGASVRDLPPRARAPEPAGRLGRCRRAPVR